MIQHILRNDVESDSDLGDTQITVMDGFSWFDLLYELYKLRTPPKDKANWDEPMVLEGLQLLPRIILYGPSREVCFHLRNHPSRPSSISSMLKTPSSQKNENFWAFQRL